MEKLNADERRFKMMGRRFFYFGRSSSRAENAGLKAQKTQNQCPAATERIRCRARLGSLTLIAFVSRCFTSATKALRIWRSIFFSAFFSLLCLPCFAFINF